MQSSSSFSSSKYSGQKFAHHSNLTSSLYLIQKCPNHSSRSSYNLDFQLGPNWTEWATVFWIGNFSCVIQKNNFAATKNFQSQIYLFYTLSDSKNLRLEKNLCILVVTISQLNICFFWQALVSWKPHSPTGINMQWTKQLT